MKFALNIFSVACMLVFCACSSEQTKNDISREVAGPSPEPTQGSKPTPYQTPKPTTAQVTGRWGYATKLLGTKSANVNSSQGPMLAPGTLVEILKEEDGWFLVRSGKKSGWVPRAEIRFVEPTPLPGSRQDIDPSIQRRYEECVRQRTAFGVDTSPCRDWAKEG